MSKLKYKKNIAMLVTNNVINDARVLKEAITLSKVYNVTIFGCGKNDYIKKEPDIEIIVKKYNFIVKGLINFSSKKKIKSKKKVKIDKENRKNNSLLIKSVQFIKSLIIRLILYLNSRTIIKAVKSNKKYFHFIHAHDLDTLKIGVKLKKFFKAKLIYDSHELWTEMSNINLFVKNKYKKIESKYIKYADVVISVSNSICNELKTRYNLIKTPYLIMNTPEYRDIESVNKPDYKKIKLLYLGYYLPGRGIEKIIESMSIIPNNVYLYMRIDLENQYTSHILKQFIRKYGVTDRVILLPFVSSDKIVNEISKYDIGILPYEPVSLNNYFCLPNKLFQYLAGGVCILANDLPDVKKIIVENKCGFTYESTNIKTLTYRIKYLVENTDTLYQYKLNSRKAYETKFNWKRIESELLEIYKDLEVTM